ncbi:DUF3073 domain-containing protein [Carbonactinospora thermoautotrophica]|uniref:DUF3073 domain-containing protein n=1 Tax=Carbonactinospora thermoautotrophica TaxID=1469144 RepID=A0A132ML06_9ACTN|nr:DUF3073 domain-containing protein [Carbonactinospora thermoautotrophica]KWW97762.1 hypothetical protein TH66_20055 [Carbonactinospora thermoautotrophica]KWW98552.1 hypothetical protein LI90_175 [Carbonactinospora thermoautotrophica]KWX06682.1 hypothetical protein TR74_21265 [Carbonactinospora thermoautotrophica]MCX9193595.1 DUF3073 domain-containing protein [Carbonactinospora thermoautotrophica]
MGRGRAKAKQTKVARQLKYNSGGVDLDRLAAELGVKRNESSFDDELDDPYAAYADYADDEDDGEDDGNSKYRR